MTIKVWDGWTRFYHWFQALLLGGTWYTARTGDMEWHLLFAYAWLALLLTRMIWGFVGSETARFGQFLKGPGGVLVYLRGRRSHSVGHNPLGGWMVVLLMLLIAVQLLSGVLNSPVFYDIVSGELSSTLSWVHQHNFNLLLGAIALHLAAIALHALRRNNLLKPMVTGYTQTSHRLQLHWVSSRWALLIFALILGIVWWVFEPQLPDYLPL